MSCPICKKPADKAYRPFCSKRCADLDLGKWLNGNYSSPAEEIEPEEAESLARIIAEKRLN